MTGPQLAARADAPRAPWGTYHVKRNGDLVTACGEFAVGWHVFWGHGFSRQSDQACRACLRALRDQASLSA